MKIVAVGQEFYIDDVTENRVEYIFSIIDQVAKDHSLIFTGLKIDGEEFYEQLPEVINNNLDNIKVIEAILKTEKQLSIDTLYSIHSYVRKSLPVLPTLVDEMYETTVSPGAWEKLVLFIEGLQWIQTTSLYIESYQSMLDFSEELENFNSAVLQKDNTYIGDIIHYEIIPRYQEIKDTLTKDLHEVS
ncbi:hypothetical protein GPJ61_12645 [Brevibacillus formosus]|uniref:hypothetical protein n=1 Tax=Brevibacillus formosus TaxID=54913 RepID=UPI001CA50121|nr:hypothetical protein [Brevibacillus formosus]MBW5468704.1 hypothetical protein [Brevibacillus formosus]